MTQLLIRDAIPTDAPAIAAIYGHHVRTTCFTFEEDAPSADDMAVRLDAIQRAGLPWLVAERDGAVVGYAYAGLFHTRSAYRFTVENAVYVAEAHLGQGIGTALMRALIAACTKAGCRQMVARLGGSNPASIALHARLGFRTVGVLTDVGFKHARWLDATLMQLALKP